jgi:hypothetical protein
MEGKPFYKNGAHAQGIAATIFDDCYHLSTEFVKIEFAHEQKEENEGAHELATMVSSFSTFVEFRYNFGS